MRHNTYGVHIYIYIYIYIYTCNVYIYIYIYTYICNTSHVYIIYVYRSTICIYIYIHHTHIYIYVLKKHNMTYDHITVHCIRTGYSQIHTHTLTLRTLCLNTSWDPEIQYHCRWCDPFAKFDSCDSRTVRQLEAGWSLAETNGCFGALLLGTFWTLKSLWSQQF